MLPRCRVWGEPSSRNPRVERRTAKPGAWPCEPEDRAAGAAWACLGLFRARLLPLVTADRGHLQMLGEPGSHTREQERPGSCATRSLRQRWAQVKASVLCLRESLQRAR